ncbi:MAG: TatD family hydrolase [Alphaproteobacteria bacterium]|nr:TatD family hydrolase [Alphaproteobacteria bacterium]
MLIDTHCHLTYEIDKDAGISGIITRAKNAGVGIIICPTADPEDIPDAIKIAETYENVFATIGIHPEHADCNAADFINDKILSHPRVLGVGEIGLDYHGDDIKPHAMQIELFERQLDMATKHGLPVAIHTRDAESDTTEILAKYPNVNGVMHCFTSSYDLAKKMLDRGFFFSASGILTFKNATDIRETFAKIPLDRLVVETDSPYCAPVPYRGKACEPAFVVETAKMLAEIKNIPFEKLSDIMVENVKKLYPKIKI